MRETIRVKDGALLGVMTSIERRRQFEDQMVRAGRVQALQGIAGRLAHDLNNPLMIVTGYAEEMRNSLHEEDPMRDDIDQILTATDRISAIAAQLLNYTRRQANPAVARERNASPREHGGEDRAYGGRVLRRAARLPEKPFGRWRTGPNWKKLFWR